MININQFLEQYEAIEAKLLEINEIPRFFGTGNSHIHVEVDVEGKCFSVVSETYNSGCGTDTFFCSVSFDEINQPMEYFKEKFQKEIDEHERDIKEREKKEAETKAIREKKLYLKLKQKFGEE